MHRPLILLFALGACSADDPNLPPPAEGPLAEVLDGLCGVLDRCPEGIGRPIAYRSRQECVAILNWAVTCRLTRGEDGDLSSFGIARRMVEVNESVSRECLAWLESAACGEVSSESGPCSEVIQFGDSDEPVEVAALGGINDPCEDDRDCEAELLCAMSEVDEMGVDTCQVCRPRPAVGDECNGNCAPGLHCSTGPSLMGNQTCHQPWQLGEPCYASYQCESEFCDITLGTIESWGECGPTGSDGEACGPSSACRSGLFCDSDNVCRTLGEMGDECADAATCVSRVCAADGRCGEPDGTPCDQDASCRNGLCSDGVCGLPDDGRCRDDDECPSGMICHSERDVCVPPGSNGSRCRRGEECVSGSCSFDDVCTEPPQIGTACGFSYQCDPRHYCADGACAERAAPGEACAGFDACREPFFCNEGTCELISLRCEPAPVGEPCAFLSVCDESAYCDLAGGFICKARIAPGESCLNIGTGESCVAGHACTGDDLGNTTCQPLPTIGEVCESRCEDGAQCIGGECIEEGPPCRGDEGACPQGMTCEQESRICLPQRGAGGQCNTPGDCDDVTFCDVRQCVARRGAGESCNDTNECQRDLYCDREMGCVPRLSLGAECSTSDETCVEGSFCQRGDSGATCVAMLSATEPCGANLECASGRCQGVCLAGEMCVVPSE